MSPRVFLKAMTFLLLALSLFFAFTSTAHAVSILHVRANGSDTGTCSTWATACTLDHALAIALNGDQLWVAQGVYKPAAKTSPILISSAVTLYGGFAPTGDPTFDSRSPDSYPTVLSGDLAGDDTTDSNGVVLAYDNIVGSDNAQTVVRVDASAVMDGFIVTGGVGQGAGLLVNSGSPIMRNMVFRGNNAWTNYSAHGGALLSWSAGGTLTLQDVSFISNASYKGTLGIYLTDASLSRILFQNNYADDQGSGIWARLDGGHLLTMTDTSFISNTKRSTMQIVDGNTTMTNIIARGNTTTGYGVLQCEGGAIYNTKWVATNVLVTGNRGLGIGNNQCDMTVTNATVTANYRLAVNTIGGALHLRNSILWNNASDQWNPELRWSDVVTSAGGVSYTIIQGGCPANAPCDHVTNVDPAFVLPVGALTAPTTDGDFRLLSSSPAIDAGDNLVTNPALPETDIEGSVRRIDRDATPDTGNGTPPLVDLGAYEFWGAPPNPPHLLYAKSTGLTSGTCSTWATACTLAYAFNAASAGDEIWVVAGVHKPTTSAANRSASFQFKSGLAVYGGFTGVETQR